MQKGLTSICIVGGGTAGWMAATLLSSVLSSNNIKITLVESPDIDTIGVGESTIPDIREFLRTCQIDIKEFVRATTATFKLGIRFDDWEKRGTSYFHPFGRVGQSINGFDFYQVWLRSLDARQGAEQGAQNAGLVQHALCSVMAENERFMIPNPQPQDWMEQNFSYAFHLDATGFARFLRTKAEQRGVTRVAATVDKVVAEQGFIQRLHLNTGETIDSDFFIDCTGFKGLLTEQTLQVGYQDWSQYLPCNRAVVVQTENVGPPRPYTIAAAQNAGWRWRIPLQHRTGNGYVFASDYCTDEEALETLMAGCEGKTVTDPRFIPFVTGKRNNILHNNCLALGLSAGFIEPLESTAIHLVYKTLIHFIKHFPDRDFSAANQDAFNAKIDMDYAEIRDFIVLHYCTTQREDTPFWQWCKTMTMPNSLHHKLSMFKERGHLDHQSERLFTRDSWWAILEGMNVRPHKNHPLMQGFAAPKLADMMANSIAQIRHKVSTMPTHQDFITANCAALKPDA